MRAFRLDRLRVRFTVLDLQRLRLGYELDVRLRGHERGELLQDGLRRRVGVRLLQQRVVVEAHDFELRFLEVFEVQLDLLVHSLVDVEQGDRRRRRLHEGVEALHGLQRARQFERVGVGLVELLGGGLLHGEKFGHFGVEISLHLRVEVGEVGEEVAHDGADDEELGELLERDVEVLVELDDELDGEDDLVHDEDLLVVLLFLEIGEGVLEVQEVLVAVLKIGVESLSNVDVKLGRRVVELFGERLEFNFVEELVDADGLDKDVAMILGREERVPRDRGRRDGQS